MRHRKDPSPEPSTEDGERKRQGQTDSLTGLPHLVEGMPAEKQKTFRELVGEILELCNPKSLLQRWRPDPPYFCRERS